MIEETSSDFAEYFWARFPNTDISDELSATMGVSGSCRATDGTYICGLDVGHREDHIDLNDRWVVFEVPHVN
jgi:hypothetical protein